ncbi:MAG: response regulator [Myxococcales bacterium]|nr:response regulator [Myxococcales bacterium]
MKPRVLVIEDNAATRKLARLTLEGEGFVVDEATSLADAVETAQARPPDVALVDVRLAGGATGLDVAARLRELQPKLPVLAVTGWANGRDARLHGEFTEVLVKPVEPSALVSSVRRHLAREADARAPSPGARVLVVDDDPLQRKLAVVALEAEGYVVSSANGSARALELARADRPDVVLSDVLMPGVDGFGLCKAMRADPALADVPVVLVSAHYLEPADRELASRLGASAYVSRLDGIPSILAAIGAALESGSREAPASTDLRDAHLARVAHQLERQAALGADYARRAAVRATALAVLDGISDTLARQVDPESEIGSTLDTCLDAAGLSVGAILLRDAASSPLVVKAALGVDPSAWCDAIDAWITADAHRSVVVPSRELGARGDALLAAWGLGSALVVPIVARNVALGALVLGSHEADLSLGEGEAFARAARALSAQLGHAVALSRMVSRANAAEQRYRDLLDNARDAIAVLDLGGVVREVNQRWERITGASRQDMIGKTLGEIEALGPLSTVEGFRALVAAGGGDVPAVTIARDGDAVEVELSVTVSDAGGETLVFVVGRDVTERRRLEAQLRGTQRMEAIGRFAGGAAHDMNNVLAAVLAYVDFVLEDLPDDDRRRPDALEIRRAAERGAALTKQLLAFSRQQVIQPQVVDLNVVVKSLSRMLRALIGEDVDVVVRLAPDLPSVKIDVGQVEQVIMNLAINARDAMPRGGTVLVATERRGESVRLVVADTGSGMDWATRQRIFEPFFTTKEPGKGTGLGLSTVFGIVRQSGGQIAVESEPGRGATFTIDWPVAGEAPAVAAADPAPTAGGHETILVVEDDDALRHAVKRTLEAHGYRVIPARSGREALLAAAAGERIHLLLTDVVLPELSGPEVAREVGVVAPDVCVLYMSGYTDTSAHDEVPVGGLRFLQKPFAPEALLDRVRTVLDQGRVVA